MQNEEYDGIPNFHCSPQLNAVPARKYGRTKQMSCRPYEIWEIMSAVKTRPITDRILWYLVVEALRSVATNIMESLGTLWKQVRLMYWVAASVKCGHDQLLAICSCAKNHVIDFVIQIKFVDLFLLNNFEIKTTSMTCKHEWHGTTMLWDSYEFAMRLGERKHQQMASSCLQRFLSALTSLKLLPLSYFSLSLFLFQIFFWFADVHHSELSLYSTALDTVPYLYHRITLHT